MLTEDLKPGMIIMINSTKACWLVMKVSKLSTVFFIVWLGPHGVVEQQQSGLLTLLDCEELSI